MRRNWACIGLLLAVMRFATAVISHNDLGYSLHHHTRLDLTNLDATPAWTQLLQASRRGNAAEIHTLLDTDPTAIHARTKNDEWTPLHVAAWEGHAPVISMLVSVSIGFHIRMSYTKHEALCRRDFGPYHTKQLSFGPPFHLRTPSFAYPY